MPRKQTNYAASSAAVGRGMVKPRAPGIGDEASNKIAQLRDIITRLRTQVAAADKLAEACVWWGDRDARCLICGATSDDDTEPKHKRTCIRAAYLASRAP